MYSILLHYIRLGLVQLVLRIFHFIFSACPYTEEEASSRKVAALQKHADAAVAVAAAAAGKTVAAAATTATSSMTTTDSVDPAFKPPGWKAGVNIPCLHDVAMN